MFPATSKPRPRRPAVPRALAVLAVACVPFLLPAASASPPLVMENSDRLEGVRSTGEYVLSGNVRFRHGDLRLYTERALWERARNRVTAEQGLRITNRGAVLTSQRGTYDRETNRARAEGRVEMRDSSGEVTASGERLDYDRVRRVAELTGNPVARRAQPARDGGAEADTLVIRGRVLRYNDSTGIAVAEGDVVITRRDLRITCGRAEYRQKEDSLILELQPVAKVEESEIRGMVIRMALDGESLRGLRVRGDAEALSREAATDSTAERRSRVTGDSLSMAFRDGAIDSVEVFGQAVGTYWEVTRPDHVNRMDGDYMVLRFREREAREADVLGSARSTYYHFERDTLKGRNRAQGRAIHLAFAQGRIEEVLVRGEASGVYEGSGLGTASDTAKATGSTGERL